MVLLIAPYLHCGTSPNHSASRFCFWLAQHITNYIYRSGGVGGGGRGPCTASRGARPRRSVERSRALSDARSPSQCVQLSPLIHSPFCLSVLAWIAPLARSPVSRLARPAWHRERRSASRLVASSRSSASAGAGPWLCCRWRCRARLLAPSPARLYSALRSKLAILK